MSSSIAALSIRQPWASAILFGGKDVENRSRPFTHRGPLLIHAATHLDRPAWRDDKRIRASNLKTDFKLEDLPRGALIGVAIMIDCVRNHPSSWAARDRWQLVLRDVVPFTRPIPYKGQLSLFKVPRHLVLDVLPTLPSDSLAQITLKFVREG